MDAVVERLVQRLRSRLSVHSVAASGFDRVRSESHVAVLPADAQATVLEGVRAALADDPDTTGRDEVAMRYRVDAYWTERLGD
jgi:hypothetical protein